MSNTVSSASSAPAIRPEAWECFLKEEIFSNVVSSLEPEDLVAMQRVSRERNQKVKSCIPPLFLGKIEALLLPIGPEAINRISEMEYHQIDLDLFKSLMIHCPQLAEKYGELFKCRHLLAERAAERDPTFALNIYQIFASKDLSDEEFYAIAEKMGPLGFDKAEEIGRKIEDGPKKREALAKLIPFADPEKAEALFQECIRGDGRAYEEVQILNALLASCPSKRDEIVKKYNVLFEDALEAYHEWLPTLATIDFDLAQKFIHRILGETRDPWNDLFFVVKELQAKRFYDQAQTIMSMIKNAIIANHQELKPTFLFPFLFILKYRDLQKTAEEILIEAGVLHFLNEEGGTLDILTTKLICNYYLGKISIQDLRCGIHNLSEQYKDEGYTINDYCGDLPLEAFADVAWVLKVTENLYPEQKVFCYLKALDAQSKIQETAQEVISSANNNNS